MAGPTIVLAGLFLILRAANQTPDGLSYALAVRTGTDMFHPHHLIYVPVARVIHLVGGIDPITATLWQNLFWMVVLAFSAWRLAGRIFSGRTAPVLAAVGLLVLRGVMIYTVRVETYLPALACLALLMVIALERPRGTWLGALVFALAILYHQTNVLFAVPLAVLLLDGGRRSMVRLAATMGTSAVIVLVAYIVAARLVGQEGGFWAFTLNYARAPIEAWGNFGYFSTRGISLLTLSQIRMLIPVRDAAAVPGSAAMLAGLVFLVIWHVVHIRRRADHLRLRLFSLIFLGVYLLFFLWWMPSDADFFVATLLPLWLLGLILISDLPSAFRSLPLAVTVLSVLATGNLYFTILPMHSEPGPGRELALAIDRAAPPGADIVAGYAVQQELLYFTERTRVHEAEGLAREAPVGDPPWTRENPVVMEVPYLQTVLNGDDEAGEFLQWLLDYDPSTMEAAAVRPLPGGAGILLGPDRRKVTSWSAVISEIRDICGC